MRTAMKKIRTSRLTRAAAVSALCAAAFTGLATVPAQAAVNTQECAQSGAQVVGNKCQFIGMTESSKQAAQADAHSLSGYCAGWGGKATMAYAEPLAGENKWEAVVQCA
jgi:hypothetical protein